MKIKSIDGVDLFFEITGTGRPIVLLHGFGNDHSMWPENDWIKILQKKYTVILPDLRGCGQSGKPETANAYSIENYIHDIDSILNNIGNIEPILWGWSLGATIAMHYMKERRIEKGIFCGTYFGPIFTEEYVRIMKTKMPGKLNELKMDASLNWPSVFPDEIMSEYLIYSGTRDGNVYRKLCEQKGEIEKGKGKLIIFEDLDHYGLIKEKGIVEKEIIEYLGIA